MVGSGLRVFALCEEGEEATTTRATKDGVCSSDDIKSRFGGCQHGGGAVDNNRV